MMKGDNKLHMSRWGGINTLNKDSDGLTLDENSSKLDKFKEDLRLGVFGGFYVLLRQADQTTSLKFILLYVLILIQLLSYSFEECLGEIWKAPQILKYVANVLSTFRLVYWLESVGWEIYIIVYYVCIFLLFFMIINFIYVAYCFQQRKFPFTWPIPLLRYSCKLIVSVLFIPILELFLKFSSCEDDPNNAGSLRHTVFTEVTCFQGIHILHVTLSYFMILIFLAMTTLINCCFYESRIGRNPVAKMHSRSHAIMLASKALYVFGFTFFRNPKSDGNAWFLSLLLFFGSAIVFASFYYDRPYYHSKSQQVLNIINGFFLWTNAVLLFSCVTMYLDFSGNLTLFVLGSPFIFIIILGLKDDRKGRLMKNLNKLEHGIEYQRYINYFMTIVETKDEDRDAAMTLKGYLHHHSEFCVLEDCPLKNFKKQQLKDNKKDYGQFGPLQQQASLYSATQAVKAQVTSLESPALLISQAKNLYMNGIKQYPDCVGLKIDFAWFLLSKVMNKRDSLKELIVAEKNRPSFEQSFMIYRYRQIIEDELYDQDANSSGYGIGNGQNGMDYVAALNYQNHFKLLKSLIEKSAMLHLDFWQMLMEDTPDLIRLKGQGAKINLSIQEVELQWKKLGQQCPPTVKALRLYSSYLIEILNDKENGNEQLAKAKELGISRIGNQLDMHNFNGDGGLGGGSGGMDNMDFGSFAADGSPCVFISGEQEKLGIITQCNMSMCKVFGYTKKDELVGKDVETLMPKMYAKYHRKFLEQAIQKPPDLLSAKERFVFGKHSTGYIFPVQLSIKNVSSFVSGRQFAATFKVEKTAINKNVAYLILDKNKNLIDASASSISMLELDLQRFQKIKAKFDISKHLEALFGANYYQYINKAGSLIDYAFPELHRIEEDMRQRKEHDEDGEEEQSMQDLENTSQHLDTGTNGVEEQETLRRGQMSFKYNNNNSRRNFGRGISLMDDEDDQQLLLINQKPGDTPDHQNQQSLRMRRRVSKMYSDIDANTDKQSHSNQKSIKGDEVVRYQYLVEPSADRSTVLQCNMVEIHFDTPNLENPTPGFYIRLENAMPIDIKGVHQIKVTKVMKQSTFQFSFDQVHKRFSRELRDKENKELMLDKAYLQLKALREAHFLKHQEDPSHKIPTRLMTISYIQFLDRFQKWQELGCKGEVMDNLEGLDDEEEDELSVDDSLMQEEQIDLPLNAQLPIIKTSKTLVSQATLRRKSMKQIDQQQNSSTAVMNILSSSGQAQAQHNSASQNNSKEFLKNEIERMIMILKKKQEVGLSVHTFRRVEPGVRSSATAITMDQAGRYEEVQYSVASLFAGRSSEVIETYNDGEDNKEEENEKFGKSNNSRNDMKNTIKSRKAFQMALTDQTMPPAIKRLSRVANFLLLCLIALAIVDYSSEYNQLKQTITNYQVIKNSQRRMSEVHKVVFAVRSLVLLNQNILTNYHGFSTKEEFASSLKDGIKDALNMIYKIQNEINLSQMKVSDAHNQLLESKSMTLYYRQDPASGSMKAIQFSLNEALLQIQSSIFTVGNMELKDFVPENQLGVGSEDVFFLLHNAFNDLVVALRKSANFYVQELLDSTQQSDELAMIIFILSIIVLTIMMAVLVPVVASVNKRKSKVLSLFCDIEYHIVIKLAGRCERYLAKLQSEETNTDDVDSNNDDILQDSGYRNDHAVTHDDDEYGLLKGSSSSSGGSNSESSRRHRAKNLTKTSKLFYLKFIAGIAIIEIYYAYTFASVREFSTISYDQVKELNNTATVERYLWFALNAQREMFNNVSKPIAGFPTSFQVCLSNINILASFTSELELNHIKRVPNLDDEYLQKFEHFLRSDLCPEQKYFPESPPQSGKYPACQKFISGIATQGLNLLLITFNKAMRLQLSTFEQLVFQSNYNYTYARSVILNTQDIYEIYVMQHYFIEYFMRDLVETLDRTIIDGLNTRSQRALFLLIFFLILLLLSYVSVLIPLVNQLNNQINKTKLMLMIVPIEILMRMKSVAKVLESSDHLIQEQSSSAGSGSNQNDGSSRSRLISNSRSRA